MSEKICKYLNTGYCKFTKTQEGCSVKHTIEVCQLTFCKECFCIKNIIKNVDTEVSVNMAMHVFKTIGNPEEETRYRLRGRD